MPSFIVMVDGFSEDERRKIQDAQTTLVAERIVRNGRGTPSMTLEQAKEWLESAKSAEGGTK
jgi:hypothetical protein